MKKKYMEPFDEAYGSYMKLGVALGLIVLAGCIVFAFVGWLIHLI